MVDMKEKAEEFVAGEPSARIAILRPLTTEERQALLEELAKLNYAPAVIHVQSTGQAGQ